MTRLSLSELTDSAATAMTRGDVAEVKRLLDQASEIGAAKRTDADAAHAAFHGVDRLRYLSELMAQQTPGGKGLLAAEIVRKTGRQHGPVDGHCEVCGQAAESFVLQDWLRWHCIPCVEQIVAAAWIEQDRRADA